MWFLLLTAILERPFLSQAGIRRDALAISLQATAFSGIVVGAVFWTMETEAFHRLWHWISDILFLLFMGSWVIVTSLKYWYVTRRCSSLLPSTWKLIWTANLVTFITVPTIHQIAAYVGAILGNHLWSHDPYRFKWWARIGPPAYNVLIMVSAILFGLSFVWPWLRRRFCSQEPVPSSPG